MAWNPTLLKRILEGALLAAGHALSIDRLTSLFEEHEAPEKAELMSALEALQAETEGRGYRLVEVASGWRFQVHEDLAPWVNRLWEEKPQRYSRALLETLALIAYRQPLTRSDIEGVRGVAVSSHIIKTLAEREWIKVVGHRDVPGRPSLYATTRQFLDYFGLKNLEELPTLSELKDFDDPNQDLNLDSNQEQTQIAEAQDSADAQEPTAEGAAGGEARDTREIDLFDAANTPWQEHPLAGETEDAFAQAESETEPSAGFEKEPSAGFEKEPSAEFEKEPSAESEKEPSAESDKQPSAEFEPSAQYIEPSAQSEAPSAPMTVPLTKPTTALDESVTPEAPPASEAPPAEPQASEEPLEAEDPEVSAQGDDSSTKHHSRNHRVPHHE